MIPFLDRINELSRKQAKEGLTDIEKVEQAKLRQDYLKLIRGQFLTTMLGISVVDSEGNDVTPLKLVDEKNRAELN
ncbi:DUF896 domain-containing protein [Paenibacillus sp. V4I5]|uniref:DUF896 domain-containing protein n=1 Tax=Paenibacillus sp. V4I5 TaxID=3042306 RepID=UPI002793F7EC|nr:DUF896 domain-containing protein [Paenibacillus sp. V4I5]MDQ0920307.1 uncharacterized protein YnzC (UPF0291/DUF896 family) [Paenibacillus sp. V4I5]